MSEPLTALKAFAERLGKDVSLVQGAGGNLSCKEHGTLWVKASGTWLAEARTRNIFVSLDLDKVQAAIARGEDNFMAFVQDSCDLRPSIETSLHALFPATIVAHVHSINTLAWAVRKDAKTQLAKRLDGLNWGWVDYVRPGLPLTRAIETVLAQQPATEVMILGNHGLIITGKDIAATEALLQDVENRLHTEPANTVTSNVNLALPESARLPKYAAVHVLAFNKNAREVGCKGALYPDHAVFLGDNIPVLTHAEQLKQILLQPPYCAVIENKAVVLGEKFNANAEAMLECLAQLAPRLPEREMLRYLNKEEIDALINWDAEKLRQEIAKQH